MRARKIVGFALSILLVAPAMVGTASAKPSVLFEGGQTRVFLSGDFVGALQALNLSAGAVGNSSLSGTVAGFPIVGGVLDLQNAKGEINHSGGLYLATRTARVELSSFNIDTTGATPILTGLVTANGDFVGRVPLFRLELPTLTLPIQPQAFGAVFIPNVKVTLSPEAAQALNATFNVSAFTAGFNIGVAQVFGLSFNSSRRLFSGLRRLDNSLEVEGGDN
jgi:hypothetical protein